MRRGQINFLLMVIGSTLLAACPGGNSGGVSSLDGPGFGLGGGVVQQLEGEGDGAAFSDKGPYRPPVMADFDPEIGCPNFWLTPMPKEEVPEGCMETWQYMQDNPQPQPLHEVNAANRTGGQIYQIEPPNEIVPGTKAGVHIFHDIVGLRTLDSPVLQNMGDGNWVQSNSNKFPIINTDTNNTTTIDSEDSDN